MLGLISYISILVVLAIGVLRWPTVGVAAVLCLYGLKQWGQSTTAFFAEHGQFTNYAVFVIVLLGLALAARKRSCIFCQFPATAKMVIALIIYALFSVAWARDPVVSLDQWTAQGPYIITVAFLAPLLFSDFEGARTAFIWTAVVGGTICTLALVFGKWGNRGLLLYGDIHEWEANPLAMASLAGTVFLIAGLSLGRPSGILMRVFSLACIPVMLAVILKSGSRGQLIASIAGVMVALPFAIRIRNTRSIAALVLSAGLIVGLGSWGASLVEIDTARWQRGDSTEAVTGRLASAETLLNASTSNFFTAVFGLGNSSSFQVIGFYPHIAGLEVVAEEGLLGAALYAAIIVLAIRSIRRISGQPELTDIERSVLATLTGLFVFEFILSWKQGSLLSSVYVFAYAITLARLEKPTLEKAPVATPADPGPPLPRFQNLMR
jgi:hypothetical protein